MLYCEGEGENPATPNYVVENVRYVTLLMCFSRSNTHDEDPAAM